MTEQTRDILITGASLLGGEPTVHGAGVDTRGVQ